MGGMFKRKSCITSSIGVLPLLASIYFKKHEHAKRVWLRANCGTERGKQISTMSSWREYLLRFLAWGAVYLAQGRTRTSAVCAYRLTISTLRHVTIIFSVSFYSGVDDIGVGIFYGLFCALMDCCCERRLSGCGLTRDLVRQGAVHENKDMAYVWHALNDTKRICDISHVGQFLFQ